MIYDVDVILHAFVLWKDLRWAPEGLDGQILLLLRVVVAAQVESFLALELLVGHPVWTRSQLVVQWAEELLHESVRELAVKVVWTLLPAAVVLHVRAALQIVKVEMRRPPEVLLAVRVVALGPLMLFVDVGAEAGLVRVDHELLETHGFLVLVQVHCELPLRHQIANRAALLGGKWQRINLLLLFVQWLYPLRQEHSLERVQLVRRRQFTVNDDEWSIEVSRAIHFELVGKGIPGESIAITLQEQNVQSDLFTLRMLYFAIGLYCYLLAEYAKQWLFVDLHERAIYWLPQAVFGLENIL